MTWGVLLMSYGTAEGPEDVLCYYTHIRHGRTPSEEQLQDLLARYQAIGGVSPLAAITRREAQALQAELDRRHGLGRFRVFLGMKHAPPFIGDAIQAMVASNIDQALGLVLAPHYSAMSVGAYLEEAQQAVQHLGQLVEFRAIRSWASDRGLVNLLAARIHEARSRFSLTEQQHLPIIFSAHSLPTRILRENDPYPRELKLTGDLVADSLRTREYTFSWQSAGRTQEPWMGPDILEKLSRMRQDGLMQALICPCGFVSDHLEVLYDLDIQAQEHARQLGMHIERTRSLNADPAFIQVLADLVEGGVR